MGRRRKPASRTDHGQKKVRGLGYGVWWWLRIPCHCYTWPWPAHKKGLVSWVHGMTVGIVKFISIAILWLGLIVSLLKNSHKLLLNDGSIGKEDEAGTEIEDEAGTEREKPKPSPPRQNDRWAHEGRSCPISKGALGASSQSQRCSRRALGASSHRCSRSWFRSWCRRKRRHRKNKEVFCRGDFVDVYGRLICLTQVFCSIHTR